jgi:uncharacterized protein (DUF2336 family)
MSQSTSFLQDLEDAVSRGTAESRLRALWHATDLLIAGRFSEEEIFIFGEVIGRIADEIEVAARAHLADRLSHADNAPINIIEKLAFDDAIDVAGPLLRESTRLSTDALVANARTKSQLHLLAISKRKFVEEAVTDILVTRGNRDVVHSAVANRGARLSGSGFLHMIKRAGGDSILAEQLGLREDIPRPLFQQLIANASDQVKRRLERERPAMAAEVRASVVDVTGALHSKLGPASRGHLAAKRIVAAQHRSGHLDEKSIFEYARFRKMDEVTVALSLLCSLPADVIERALADKKGEMILILAKALEFSWSSTMALLFLGAKDHRITTQDLRAMEAQFRRLRIQTSRDVLKLYGSRKGGTDGDTGTRNTGLF